MLRFNPFNILRWLGSLLKMFMGLALVHFQKYWLLSGYLYPSHSWRFILHSCCKGGGHAPLPPSFFQISYITLSQLGGHIIPNQYYVPPGFSNLAIALYYTLKNSCSEWWCITSPGHRPWDMGSKQFMKSHFAYSYPFQFRRDIFK